MAKVGLNISASYTYTTGVHSDTYCNIATDGSTGDDYPTTRGGFTFGWTDRGSGAPRGRDRVTTGDERLRGIGFNSVTIGGGAARDLRIDKTGSQKIRIAVGDAGSAQTGASIDVRDSAGSKFTVTGDTGSGEFYDAANNLRTSESDWASNNTQSAAYTFTDYVLVRINEGSGTATALAHVEVEDGASTTTLSPSNASLTITGHAPALLESLTPSNGSLSITGQAPAVGVGLNPANASLSLTGFAPLLSEFLTPGAASLSLTGFAPTVIGFTTFLTPDAASLSLTGFAPDVISGEVNVAPDAASLTITGFAPTITGATTTVSPDAATLTLTGFAPTLSGITTFLTPANASLTITAYAPVAPIYTLFGPSFTYDVQQLGGRPVGRVQVYYRAGTGTVYARLWDVTDSVPVSDSMVSTAGTSFAEQESDQFAFADDHEYRIQFGHESGDDGEFLGARLVLERPYA